eukprot:CAMPEP_0116100718 /NCGR_PEP_ID=MMETSP0327-20121206/12432_1 /TAXON_ID=44447 /ORGANISM="Pseudo-nitzschia delicatissima, Strain B596" /LENGTH=385 /DNA_ID=CAMNT_0003592643 /DNA_START=40 /DNA_END=1197 /DNA_ORIENTATION=+
MKTHTSMTSAFLWVLALSSGVQTSHAFRQVSIQAQSPRLQQQQQQQYFPLTQSAPTSSTSLEMSATSSVIGAIRGGAICGAATSAVTGALQSGPFGVLGVAAIAASVVTPLTIYRQAYSFSVAYSLTFVALGLILQNTFALAEGTVALKLCGALVFYGARLAAHLLLREVTVKSKREVIKSFDKTPRLKRIPFAASIGLFYGFMGTPALYLCRSGSALTGTALSIAKGGVALAWFGAIVEAWTDAHKFWAKRGKDEAMDFTGPSTWWYGVSRHPNYFAEIVFWVGVLVSGLPAMVSPSVVTIGSGVAALCSVLGTFGILNIMLMATKRLEGKQDEKYGGQIPFEEWKAKTSKLFPTKLSLAMILPISISVGLICTLSNAVVSCLV